MNTLNVDPERWKLRNDESVHEWKLIIWKTGASHSAKLIRLTDVYVRALNPETQKYEAIDIAFLDTESLTEWLQSRGGYNQWAENTVLLILGHETAGGPYQVAAGGAPEPAPLRELHARHPDLLDSNGSDRRSELNAG